MIKVAEIILATIVAYVLVLGPGQAWRRGRASALPRVFAQIAGTLVWTSLVGTMLAASGHYALPTLVLINSFVTLAGYLQVARRRYDRADPMVRRGGLGAVLAAAALLLYWPPQETFLHAADSSAYLAMGEHVSRTGGFRIDDSFAATLPPELRQATAPPVFWGPPEPPYNRWPGGIVIDSYEGNIARPAFFPLPSVWAAISRDLLGRPHAGAYAGLFCALAIWATWLLARASLGPGSALLVSVVAATNGLAVWIGRYPLSEPMAWFFVTSGLAALSAWEEDGFPGDAALAGLLLGATAFARIEYAVFVGGALLLHSVFYGPLRRRHLPIGFFLLFGLMIVITGLASLWIGGAHATTLTWTAEMGLSKIYDTITATSVFVLVPGLMVATAALVLLVRVFGTLRFLQVGMIAGVLFTQAYLSYPHTATALGWLRVYLGVPTLVLGAIGLGLAWKRRLIQPGSSWWVALSVSVALIVLYDPHVTQVLPWAGRRMIPVLLGGLLLGAGTTVAALARYSRVAACAAALLVLTGAWPAVRASAGYRHYAGTLAALDDAQSAVPEHGTLLIDRRLDDSILGPALWLHYGRTSIPVPPPYTPLGRDLLTYFTYNPPGGEPVWHLKPALLPTEPVVGVKTSLESEVAMDLILLKPEAQEAPHETHRAELRYSLFRLEPPLGPRSAEEAVNRAEVGAEP